MAYGKIHETFWDDPVLRDLARGNEDTRTFMAYLITCRHKNRLGCYVLDFHYAAADLGWSEERIRVAVAQLEDSKRIQYDSQYRVVLVLRFLKFNTLENHKVVTGAIAALRGLPSSSLVHELAARVEKYKLAHYVPLIKELENRIGNGIANGMAYSGTSHPQPQPQPQPEKNTAVAEASLQTPHAHEVAAASNGGSNGRDEAIEEMESALGELLVEVPAQKRKGFSATSKLIIRGDTPGTWQDPRTDGSQVPWIERAPLFRIAAARCIAENQFGSNALHSSLRFVLPQQLTPFHAPKQRTRVGIDSDKPVSSVPVRESRQESISCPQCGLPGGRMITYTDTGEIEMKECGHCPADKSLWKTGKPKASVS